jgi:hypothetical protein
MAKLVFGMNHPAVKITEKLFGVAGFDAERGSGPAEFATILLPNCSVRSRTGHHQATTDA